ncbi:SpaA isopeptide-forming pilin-related protein [Oscillospiraceae bacterium 50-16]
MKKIRFSLTRMTAMLLVLVCMLGLLPATALAASPSTIKMDDCTHNGVKYESPALGTCHLHQMHFGLDGKSTMGFCAEKGKGMGWSLEGHTWGNPQPISDPTVTTMMAYFYAHSTGVFTDQAKALGVDDVWDSGYTWTMNAWVQAIIWRYKAGLLSDPVTACAEELLCVYNNLEHTSYTSIDDVMGDKSFRDRAQYILDLGAQGVWGECSVYEYAYTGSGSKYHPASDVQAIMIGELNITRQKYDLTVKKVDSTNPNKGLPGARFKVASENGTYSKEIVTGSDGTYTLSALDAGTYSVTELEAPEGYEIDNPGPQYVVLPNGSDTTVTVTFTDTPEITGEGSIRKVDADDPTKGLAGAVIEIIGVDNDFTGTYVTGAGGYLTDVPWKDMPIGSYTATEVTPPEGYTKSPETSKVKQSFRWDGKTDVALVFENDAKVKVKLIKLDDSGNPLPGAVFNIVKDGQIVGTEATKADGSITVTDVTEGMYAFVEVSAPAPYATLTEPVIAHVDQATINGGGTVTVTAADKKLPSLSILKRDAQTKEVIPGTVFEIKGIHYGYHNDVTTGADGKAVLSNIPVDSYEVIEKSVPDPYVVGDEPMQTIYLGPGEDRELIFDNRKQPLLTIAKMDADTNDIIPGTVFTIEGVSNDYRNDVTTGADGTVSLRLAPGSYRITEKSVPAPYYLPSKNADREQTVSLNPGDEKTLTFKDHKAPELTIFKEDSVAGAPIEGAKFHVTYTSNGEAADAPGTIDYGYIFTDARGEIKVHEQGKKLYPGEYTVTEVAPAPGFQMKEPTTQKVIIHGGESKTLTFLNEPLNAIIIEKYDSVTHEALPGCTFQLRYLGGTSGTGGTVIGQKVTGKNGTAIWTGLKSGTYVVEEVDPADGYSIINASETVYLADSGEQSVVTVRFDNAPDGILLVRKVCSVNPSITLQDAEFKIMYADGTLIGDSNGIYRTDENGEIRIPGLKPGKSVVVTETRAPAGFIIDTQSQAVQIKEGRTVTLTFKNQPKGSLIIQKRDSLTGQPLPGAEFRVATAAGCEVGLNGVIGTSTLTQNGLFTTDSNGEIRITNLAPGAYVLTETKAPAGYVMDSPSTNVVIGANGDTQTIIITNTPKATLTITKRDAVTRKPLANAEFIVRDSEGHAVGPTNGIYKTGTDGTVVVSGLEPGSTVMVSETKAPTGYILNETPKSIVVKAGISNSLIFDNEPGTTLIIRKFIEGTENEPLSGVCFKVVDGSGAAVGPDDGTYYTDKAGEIVLDGIEPGTTVIAREIKTVEGYVIDGTPQDILIKGGEVQQLTFWNKRAGSLVIQKKDSVTGALIAGAQFQLTYASGGFVDNANGHLSSNGLYTTDDKGEIRISGVTGTIVAKEVKAAPGYVIDQSTQTQTVTVNPEDTQTLVFLNEPLCSLTLTKLDSVTGKPVPGTEFTVKDGNGTVLGRYTTGKDGTVTVSGLVPGSTVVVSESKVPSGYVLNTTPQTIIVRNGSNSITSGTGGNGTNGGNHNGDSGGNDLTFENDPKTNLIIEKYVTGTTDPLKGVTFLVTESNGQVVGSSNGEYITDENGRIVIEGLEPGVTVTVKEIKTLEGFVLDTTPKSIKIKAGEAQTLRFYNAKQGCIVVKKLDKQTGEPLAGVEFQITYSDGSYLDDDYGHLSSKGLYKTDANGEIRISGVVGTLVITETKPLPGYVMDEGTRTQTVKVNASDTQTITVYNTKVGGLTIIKTDEETGERISGVQFEIRKLNGEIIGTYTTDRSGVISLPEAEKGWYQVTELKAAKGYQLDSQPYQIEVKDGGTATLEITNRQTGSAIIHKIDSVTGKGIFGVKFLLSDAKGNPVGTYESDNEGYVYVDGGLADGKYTVREIECADGYILDTQPKTIYVEYGGCTTITWKNTAVTGQIQITKTSADYNSMNGWPTGTPIPGTVFEVYHYRTGNLVDTIRTDKNGVAVSKPLPLGRYKVVESQAADFYALDKTPIDVEIEHAGQIVKAAMTNKSLYTNVAIQKTGYAEVMPGQNIRYTFSNIANNSTTALTSFYWRDTLPVVAVRLAKITTGTYNAAGSYKIVYKTNLSGSEYRVLADSLNTQQNYVLEASPVALRLASNEYVTEVMFVFGVVPANFRQVEAPKIDCTVVSWAKGGSQFVNQADVGGVYNGQWIIATTRWVTKVYAPPTTLPRTGY